MKKCIFIITGLVLIASVCSAQQQQTTTTNKNLKDWTAKTSIAIRYISGAFGKSILPSPDGKYFYFATYKGDFKSDCLNYDINVFRTEDVLAALKSKKKDDVYLKPLRTVTVSANILKSADASTTSSKSGWTADSKSIVFIKEADATKLESGPDSINTQLCKINISNGSLEIFNIGNIYKIKSYNKDGSTIVFNVYIKIPRTPKQQYPESVIPTDDIFGLLFQNKEMEKIKIVNYLYHNGKISELPDLSTGGNNNYYMSSWLSPDGSRLIVSQPKISSATDEFSRFMLINTNQPANPLPLIKAPLGMNTVGSKFDNLTNVLFTADSKYAILVNSALPLKEHQSKPDEMAYIVAVNLENGQYETLSSLESGKDIVNDVSWNKEGDELLISYKNDKEVKAIGYRKEGPNWIKDSSPKIEKLQASQLPDGLKVFVRQDVNTPPMVVASNGNKEIYLTETDPALENVYIAPAKEISWRTPDGRTLTGQLILPKGYEKMKPLPLIVENYGFDESTFNPDDKGCYLVQSFTANGYAVLKLDLSLSDLIKIYGDKHDLSRLIEEGPHYVEMVDVAVKMLADSGLVDPNKVGTMGFSRGGYENLYAVTHPGKIKPAAAICIDFFNASIYNYLTGTEATATPKGFEEIYHGSFWKNKKSWLEHEPVFNVDKVRTPLLMMLHGYGSDANINTTIAGYSDLMGAFQINKKPLEVLMYPKSGHGLTRPREIYSATISIVDWMNFWLKGVEDPDTVKAAKYVRWRKMRKIQEAGGSDTILNGKMKGGEINTPAPKFSLVDLEGKKVSLEELKGKTVILDFWATWCEPCIASFPAMQRVVDKYATDSTVKFLFIDTMEKEGDENKKNVANFIERSKFPFHVLLDVDNKAFESYKVTALPTKFIIDKEGILRFKNGGFNGSADAMVEELSKMIETAKKEK